LFDLKKLRPTFAEKHEKTFVFFGGHTNKGLHDLCGRKFVGKVVQYLEQFVKNRAKILRTPKNCLLLHPGPYTRGLSQGENVAEGGPLASTQKKVNK